MNIFSFVVVVALGICLVVGGIVGLNYFRASYICHAQYSEYQPQYGYLSGCRIMWNGKLTPPYIIYAQKQ